jgi:hypothetical protein
LVRVVGALVVFVVVTGAVGTALVFPIFVDIGDAT